MYCRRNFLITSLILAIAVLGTACTQAQATVTKSVDQIEPTDVTLPTVRVGIYVDDAFGDRAFFDIALEAVPIIEEEFNATVNLYEGRLNTDNYGPLFDKAADNCDIVFILGHQPATLNTSSMVVVPCMAFNKPSSSNVLPCCCLFTLRAS